MSRQNTAGTELAGRQRPSRWYACAASALAVFLIGLIVYRSPVHLSLVEATVAVKTQGLGQTSSQGETTGNSRTQREQQLTRLLTSKGLVSEVLGTSDSRAPDPQHAAARDPFLERVRQHLKVSSSVGLSPDVTQLRVQYLGADQPKSLRFVDELIERFVDSHGAAELEASRSAHELAKQAATAAGEEANRAKHALDRWLQDNLRETSVPFTYTDVDSPPAAQPPRTESALEQLPAVTAQVVRRLNPERSDLNDEIAQLESQRVELLETRTELHPEVERVEARLARLKTQLEDVPEYLTEIAHPDAVSTPTSNREDRPVARSAPSPTHNEKPVAPVQNVDRQLAAQFQRLQHDYEVAHRRHQESVMAERDALRDHLVSRESRAWIVEAPHVVRRVGSSPTPRKLLSLVMLAMVCGGLSAGLAGAGLTKQVFRRVQDVQEMLAIPAVGTLATGDPPIRMILQTARIILASWIVWLSEVVIVVAAIIMFYSALTQDGFVTEVANNPFGAFFEALDRLH